MPDITCNNPDSLRLTKLNARGIGTVIRKVLNNLKISALKLMQHIEKNNVQELSSRNCEKDCEKLFFTVE